MAAEEDVLLVFPEVRVGQLAVDAAARVVEVLAGEEVHVHQTLALLQFGDLEDKESSHETRNSYAL